MSFIPQKTKIKGLSDRRRLPKLGKIRLGFKLKKGTTEYPAELPFFLLPPEVARVFGKQVSVDRAKELGVTRQDVLKFIEENTWRLAEELEIMFPMNEIEAVFPQAYIWYGSSQGAKCKGDGETAYRDMDSLTDGNAKIVEPYSGQPEMLRQKEVLCPCDLLKSEANPKGECTQRGHLMVMVPKVNVGGIYQIDIGSYNSIVDVNSGIDYTSALLGRFALVPLILRRIPTITHHDKKRQIHFTCQVIMNVPIQELEQLRRDTSRILQHSKYALPVPEEINPDFDKEGEVIMEAPLEEAQPSKPEEAQETPLTFEQKLLVATTPEELQITWHQICVDPELKKKDKGTLARNKALNKLKEERKQALQARIAPPEPDMSHDMKVVLNAIVQTIEMAETQEAMDAIVEKVWGSCTKEQQAVIHEAIVKRMNAITPPEETTTQEPY